MPALPTSIVPRLQRRAQQPGEEPATAPSNLQGTLGGGGDQAAQLAAALSQLAAASPEAGGVSPLDPAIAAALPAGFAEAAQGIQPEGLEEINDPSNARRFASIVLASIGEALSGQPGMGTEVLRRQQQSITDARSRNRERVQTALKRRLDLIETGLEEAQRTKRGETTADTKARIAELQDITKRLSAEAAILRAKTGATESGQRFGPGGIEETKAGADVTRAGAAATGAGAQVTRAETERDITAPAQAELAGARAGQAEATGVRQLAEAEAIPERLEIARGKLGVEQFRSESDRRRADAYVDEVARKSLADINNLELKRADLQFRIENAESVLSVARRRADIEQQKLDADTDAKLTATREQFGRGLEQWYMTLAAQRDTGDEQPVISLPNGAKFEGAEEILKLLDQAAEIQGRSLEFNDRRAVEQLKRFGRDVIEPILEEFTNAESEQRTGSRLKSLRSILPGG